MALLHFFNPGHETAILNESPYYTLPAHPLKMQQDLSYLPAWYASPEDRVKVYEPLTEEFTGSIVSLPPLPKAICREDIFTCKEGFPELIFTPWGLSPQCLFEVRQWNENLGLNLNLPEWNPVYKDLSGRETAKDCLEYLIDRVPGISRDIVPCFCSSEEEIGCFMETHAVPLLIKSPYSSSGRGLLWILNSTLGRSERQILRGMLKKQGSVSIEPVWDKQLDLALEFSSSRKNRVEFKGYSLFQTDSKGAYQGNVLISQDEMESRITAFINRSLLEKIRLELTGYLNDRFSSFYQGCIGVDMLVYKTHAGYFIHPCLEINVRYNMGWLAMHFYSRFCKEESSGVFRIDFHPEGGKLFQEHIRMKEEFPLILGQDSKIQSGYLTLCPVTETSKFRAFVLIA